MKLRLLASVSASVLGLFVAEGAFASTKKNTGSSTRPAPLVAMSGTGSLASSSGERGAYVGIGLFPFTMSSATVKVGNTSVDTPSSEFKTVSKQLDFYGNFGNWVLRPTLDLGLSVAGNQVSENTSYLGIGYMFASNLELGAALSYARSSVEGADKSKATSSKLLLGPQAVYYTELAGYQAEVEGRLFLVTASADQSKDNTTTTTVDASGFGFEVQGNVVRELTSSLEYVGAVKVGYSSLTDKADKNNERTDKSFDFTIIPAGLRYKF
ncbi:hypothetical protein EBU99_06570 [bacterium]|nr:hypothetical protein [bacterium]